MSKKLDQWLVFLDNSRKELKRMAIENNEEIKKANELYEELTEEEKEYLADVEFKREVIMITVIHQEIRMK